MTIETAYKESLKRLKRESKKNVKEYARKLRMPYNTVKALVREDSMGNIRTWLKVERYFNRQDSKSL